MYYSEMALTILWIERLGCVAKRLILEITRHKRCTSL